MSQSTLDDDELFGEAAAEVREDVETSLAAARSALPDGDRLLSADAENTIGVLNGLKSALDPEDARNHLHEAKKWYTIGKRADAFEDPQDLEAEIEEVESLIADVDAAHDQASELASTVPALRDRLNDS